MGLQCKSHFNLLILDCILTKHTDHKVYKLSQALLRTLKPFMYLELCRPFSKFWLTENFKVCLPWFVLFLILCAVTVTLQIIHSYWALCSIREWSWKYKSWISLWNYTTMQPWEYSSHTSPPNGFFNTQNQTTVSLRNPPAPVCL